jgi:PAS domain S-box-containing protein
MRFLTIAVILTGIVLMWLSAGTYRSNKVMQAAERRHFRISQLRGTIIHLDEVLTMSARMAAATGDLTWEARYHEYEPMLEAAIKEAIASAPQTYAGDTAAKTNAANIKLVEMEKRAFELVRQHRAQDARTLLFSNEYESQKQIYAEGMKRFAELLYDSHAESLAAERRRAYWNITLGMIVTVILLIGWLFVLRTIQAWRTTLRGAHDALETRVRQRTAELAVANEGLQREVAERMRAETALRASEMKFRTLYDSSQDAIMVLTPQEGFLAGNPAALKLFGCEDEEEFTSCTPADLSPEYQADGTRSTEKAQEMMAIAMRNGSHFFEWTHRRKDGAQFFATVLLTRVVMEGHEYLQATVRDITDQKRAAEALQAAKEAAEVANRAKSDFLANMSHEIRTPMNAIIGMTELVLDTSLAPSQHEYLKMVRESANSLLTIINDILDFSKIEAGKLDLEETSFSLRERVGDVMKSLALRAHAKGIELAWRIPPDTPDMLLGDPTRLGQIILNLVGNAVKFTSSGEVVLEVTCDSRTETEVVLRYSVRDTGIGIPEDKVAVIFDAFTQADTSTTRKHGGTGLGLAIATRLVDRMGGRIWAESKVGEGSVFRFVAPFKLATGVSGDLAEVSPGVVRGTRVLIVDDSATNRMILEEMTRQWGMHAESAASAAEAIRKLRDAVQARAKVQLVLTDVNMPDVDGLTLTEWIRQDSELADTAVIVLTSGARPDDRKRCEQLRIAEQLLKPVKPSELSCAIGMSLGVLVSESKAGEAVPRDAPFELPALRFLLAEDSHFNQKLAIGLMTKHGHSITTANNGKEAIAALESDQFDVVLMDVEMPEMDGFEATAVIRTMELQTGEHLPIIAMTAHAMKGDRERCLEAGMDGYVSKPIHTQQLFEVVKSVLQDRSLRIASRRIP